ncbi:MDGA2 protein, partial [Oreocharis arfaki]|nr:MDGA2 protein [Oreocharis arfaki]
MYIETSRPRLEGEKARLVSPVFSVAPKNPYGATNTAYCFSFYYHMYGQHIGERKPMSWSFPLGKTAGKTSSCLKEKRGRSASPSKGLL